MTEPTRAAFDPQAAFLAPGSALNDAAIPSASAGAGEPSAQPAAALSPDALKLIGDVFEQRLEALTRKQQSANDKLESRISGRFQQQIAALQSAGVTLNQDQTNKLAQQTRTDVLADAVPNQPDNTAQPAQAAQTAAAPNPQTAAAWNVMDALGMDIDDEQDPEAKTIDWSSPEKARATTIAAIAAKRQRIAAGSVPLGNGVPSTTPAHLGKSSRETLDMYDWKKITGG